MKRREKWARLSSEEVENIRRLITQGVPRKDVCAEYALSKQRLSWLCLRLGLRRRRDS